MDKYPTVEFDPRTLDSLIPDWGVLNSAVDSQGNVQMIDYWNTHGAAPGMERLYSTPTTEIHSNIIRVCTCVCFQILIITKFSIYWIKSSFHTLVKCMPVDKPEKNWDYIQQ